MAFGAFAPLPVKLGTDAEEEISASQWLRICADLTDMLRVAPFAVMDIDFNGSSSTFDFYTGRNGRGVADQPVIALDSYAGVWSLTWPRTYVDAAGIRRKTTVQGARGVFDFVDGGADPGRFVVVEPSARNKLLFDVAAMDGTPAATGRLHVVVF